MARQGALSGLARRTGLSPGAISSELERLSEMLELPVSLYSVDLRHLASSGLPESGAAVSALRRREREALRELTGRSRLLDLGGGLEAICAPWKVEADVVAWFVAGPFTRRPLDGGGLRRAAEALGVGPEALEALPIRPLPTPGVRRVARQLSTVARFFSRMATEWHRERRLQARLRALNRTGVRLASTRHLKPVLREALGEALSLTGSTAGSIMLVEDGRLRIYVAKGLKEEVLRRAQPKVGEGIAGWVAKTGRPLVLRRGAVYKRSLSRPSPERAEAAACLPMKVRGEVIGVLNVKGKEDGFTEDDVNLLSILASHVAAAIHNVRLYEGLQRKIGELKALSEVATLLSSSLDPREVLSMIVKHSLSLLNAKRASVMLLEKGGVLKVVASKGLPRGAARAAVKVGEGIAGWVAETGRPLILKRGEKHPLSKSGGAPAAVSVPLKAKGKVVGVLNVSEKADGGNFTKDDLDLLVHFARQAAVAIENAELYREIRSLFDGMINALAVAIDARDPYTRHHSERVSRWATEIAEEMGLSAQEIEAIRYAALLHDVGKIGIPESVLLKPSRLSADEFSLIQKHPTVGAQIVGTVEEFRHVIPYIYHHHERFASGGYPEGIGGEDIPIGARIIAVADTYDALTSDRPYRKALSPEEAVWELKRAAGSQLDPEVVRVFLEILRRRGIKV